MSIHFDSESLSPYCIGAFLLVFVVLLIIGLRSNAKRKQQIEAIARQFGFTPLPTPPPELMSALSSAFVPSTVARVKNVYRRIYGDEQVFLLDIYSRSASYGNDNEESVDNSSLVTLTPHLDLPPFILFHRIQAPGKLGGLLNSLLEKTLAQSMLKNFQDVPPEFDINYALYTLDDAAAAQCFTPEILTRIASMQGINARGQGRLLVVSSQVLRQGGKLDSASFSIYLETARSLCDLLVK